MSLMNKFRTIDKEIEKLLEKESQKKWLNLMLGLCEVEKRIGKEVTRFSYNNGELLVRITDKDYVRTFIGEKDVQGDNKN